MLNDKTAIVTGAGTGIGRAIAARLHAEGARVVLAGRRRDKLEETARLLGDRTLVVPTDVTVPAQVQALADAAAVFGDGRIDILVNNAGVMRFAPLGQADEAHWQEMMDVNCWGPRRLMAAVLPAMRAGGGSIVNIASIAGEHAFPGAGAYGAAKRALRHISQVLAMEEAGHGIRVNVICPGVVQDTELLEGAGAGGPAGAVPDHFCQPAPAGPQRPAGRRGRRGAVLREQSKPLDHRRGAAARRRAAPGHQPAEAGLALTRRSRQLASGTDGHTPRSSALMPTLARVCRSTCLTMTAQYRLWLPSAAGRLPGTTTAPAGTRPYVISPVSRL